MATRRSPDEPFPGYGPPSDDGDAPMLSAEEVYAREQAGEKEFNAVYKFLYRELKAYARFRCDPQVDWQDVMQEVWSRAAEQDVIALCGGDLERIGAYLRGMVRNQIIDEGRSHSSRRQVIERYALSLVTRVKEPELPHEYVLSRELDASLGNALRKLPDACREVFILCRMLRKSYDEVAEELGISRNTVATHMRTAIGRLKTELAPFLEVESEGKEHMP